MVSKNEGFSFDLGNGYVFYCKDHRLYDTGRMLQGEIFTKRRYARKGWEIQPTDTVVDIGANMGMFLLWASAQATHGKILGIEPSHSFETLALNRDKNDLHRIEIVRAAVASKPGMVDMHYYPGQNALSHVGGMKHTFGTRFFTKLLFRGGNTKPIVEPVVAKTLPTILAEQGIDSIDYLKIDCEGAEYDIFEGISDELFKKVKKIALEYHELQPGQKVSKLVDRLKKVGFDVEVVSTWFSHRVLGVGEIWAMRKDGNGNPQR